MHLVKHCPMQKSFAVLHKRWVITGFDFKNAGEIYEEHAALTKGTTIDISDLNYAYIERKKIGTMAVYKKR